MCALAHLCVHVYALPREREDLWCFPIGSLSLARRGGQTMITLVAAPGKHNVPPRRSPSSSSSSSLLLGVYTRTRVYVCGCLVRSLAPSNFSSSFSSGRIRRRHHHHRLNVPASVPVIIIIIIVIVIAIVIYLYIYMLLGTFFVFLVYAFFRKSERDSCCFCI